MTKIIVSRAVEFIGTQSLVFSIGLLVVMLCHALFDLSTEDAARNVFAAQMIAIGWVVRGWWNTAGEE